VGVGIRVDVSFVVWALKCVLRSTLVGLQLCTCAQANALLKVNSTHAYIHTHIHTHTPAHHWSSYFPDAVHETSAQTHRHVHSNNARVRV
jgi:hypothetical protein